MHGRRISSILSLVAAVIAIAGAFTARGQLVGGAISGYVTDSAGASVVGAEVIILNQETGSARQLATSKEGAFSAPSIPVGVYTVSVRHADFAPLHRTGISLSVGQSIALQ